MEHEGRDDDGDADQHGEGIVVDIAGLQPHDPVGHVDDTGRDPIRAEAVDDGAVALLPEDAADGHRRLHEQGVVKLVEVPLVEQEQVDRAEGARRSIRQRRHCDVVDVGQSEAGDHGDGRGPGHEFRHLVHGMHDVVVRALEDRPAPEFLVVVADEVLLEDEARRDGADGEHQERDHHHRRALVRMLEGLVIGPRLAVERHEHQAPGVERRHERRDHQQPEGVVVRRMASEGRFNDGVLGVEAGEADQARDAEAGQRQRADQHHRPSQPQLRRQAAHLAHVLLVMHGVND